jgi:APA family basic amino acid/polyamine antiporter
MCLLVMDPGITAALAVGLADYFGYLFGLSAIGLKATAVSAIVVLAALNIAGAGLGAGMVRWLTILKLALLAFILIWGFGLRLGDWSNFLPLMARGANAGPLVPALAGLCSQHSSRLAVGGT